MKTCKQCSTPFLVTDEDRAFLDKISPIVGGQKYLLPEPTHCPDCRQQRRLAKGNQMKLYKRKCDLTGAEVVSNFHPDSPHTVYYINDWHSDKWDAMDYGRDFDFTRPFFEQFKELMLAVPITSLHKSSEFNENSEYTNYAGKNKDCYLLFDSDFNRDCYMSYSIGSCENCMDCFRVRKSQFCYESIDCINCYNSFYLQDCENCSDSFFLKNCSSCKNCIMSSNLVNKEYYIQNEYVGKEKFEIYKKQLLEKEDFQKLRDEFQIYIQKFPQKSMHGVQNENVFGDYITNSKNAYFCFDSSEMWDCRYVYQSFLDLKDSMDAQECGGSERVYESEFSGFGCQGFYFCSHCLDSSSELLYCYKLFHSKNCFGCSGLRQKEYCILNKQYTKEEYEELVPKIIEHMKSTGEWGEGFPVTLSPFTYNETIAQDHYPLTKEEVLSRGWRWRDESDHIPDVSKKIPAEKLPRAIEDIPDDILNWAIICTESGRPFKLIKQELDFYRRHKLPVPHLHPDERHKKRMSLRNKRTLYKRECNNCQKEIQTTYSPKQPVIVYCEDCYLVEVY